MTLTIIMSVPKVKDGDILVGKEVAGLTNNHQKNISLLHAIFGEKARDSWRLYVYLTVAAVLSAMYVCSHVQVMN